MTEKKLVTIVNGQKNGKAAGVDVVRAELLKSLIKNELKYKYNGNKILAYADIQEEQSAIAWLRTQMGWTLERPPHSAFDPH